MPKRMRKALMEPRRTAKAAKNPKQKQAARKKHGAREPKAHAQSRRRRKALELAGERRQDGPGDVVDTMASHDKGVISSLFFLSY